MSVILFDKLLQRLAKELRTVTHKPLSSFAFSNSASKIARWCTKSLGFGEGVILHFKKNPMT
jgi:hypothetical protein